ncbi:MAG: polyprenol monophosphomannose synthase [SAR202 cluster bacterium]|nr:polyprenol monophosphomannose synthase [SAR202 cluster bacterium]|tara:strand:+ start:176 stop:886 length:711 start_codon:yes stop_codon:yes gene_type:complete
MQKNKVSIIIPTYNERDNVPIVFKAIDDVLDGKWHYQIIVVDDSSPDGTGMLVTELSDKDDRIKLIERPGKLGLGSAVVAGFDHSDGDYLVMMDADLSHDPKYLPDMLLELSNHDIVIGSRYVDGGGVRNWPLWRRIVSLTASAVGRSIVGLNIRDITAGFAAFKRDHVMKLSSDLNPKGFKLLLEILAKSPRARIKECPIVFADRRFGRSKASFHEIILFIQLCFQLRSVKKIYE